MGFAFFTGTNEGAPDLSPAYFTVFAIARNLSGFALHVPKQMAGAIWDGLVRSSAWDLKNDFVARMKCTI